MIQPYLSNGSYTYVTVDGLIWLSSGLKLPTNLEEKACSSLNKIYREINLEQPLVIDFRNVSNVSDRALEDLFKSFQNENRETILMNYEGIIDTIDQNTNELYKKESSIVFINEDKQCKIFNKSNTDFKYLEGIEDLRRSKIKEYVKICFTEFPNEEFLPSTPFKATGIFDASKLITNHTAFFWISLQLSDLLKNLLNSKQISLKKEIRILTVNLKSSPFASVVSMLNKIPLTTIDHLGPKHKVYDLDVLYGLENHKKYNYIYIGDFCVGGTEIKIAQTYASISNSELNTAIVIGSYFDNKLFENSFNLYSLVEIKNLHPKAKFTI